MAGLLQNRKALAFITATLACAALVSLVLVHPKPVSDPLLGDGWHCSKAIFVTSCTRIDRNKPVARSPSIAPIEFRRA